MSNGFNMEEFTRLMMDEADKMMRKKAGQKSMIDLVEEETPQSNPIEPEEDYSVESVEEVDEEQDEFFIDDSDEDLFSAGTELLTNTNSSLHTIEQEKPVETRDDLADYTPKTNYSDETFKSIEEAVSRVAGNMEEEAKHDKFMQDMGEELRRVLSCYESDIVKAKKQVAYADNKTNKQTECKYAYKKDTMVVAGESFTYTRLKEIPKWSEELQDCLDTDDKELNLRQLKTKITTELLDYYGGGMNIKTIAVQDYQLVINKVLYMPVLNDAVLARLPFDSADYIKNGCLAPFFDWKMLTRMQKLYSLSFDNIDIVMQDVAYDLGYGRDFNPLKLFKICSSLSVLDIGGEVVRYPFEDSVECKESAKRVVSDAEAYTKYDKMYDSYTTNVCNNLGNFRRWNCSNLVNYAKNRGGKGLFRYSLGVVGRTAGVVASGTLELGARGIGGVFKGIGHVLKNAVTEINDSDMKK